MCYLSLFDICQFKTYAQVLLANHYFSVYLYIHILLSSFNSPGKISRSDCVIDDAANFCIKPGSIRDQFGQRCETKVVPFKFNSCGSQPIMSLIILNPVTFKNSNSMLLMFVDTQTQFTTLRCMSMTLTLHLITCQFRVSASCC